MKSLNEIVAELRMGDDGGKPAYRIGRADKVEVSMPSGTPVRSYVIECVTIKELADWIEAAVARERGPCNAAAMREALAEARKVIKAMGGYWAMVTLPIIDAALSAPPRQCDVGTAEDQSERFAKYCDRFHRCNGCPCCGKMKYNRCEYIWMQTPYEAEEGGAE